MTGFATHELSQNPPQHCPWSCVLLNNVVNSEEMEYISNMLRNLLRGKLAFPSLQVILKLYTLYLDKLV